MTQLVTWRLLFEMLQFRLIGPLRLEDRTAPLDLSQYQQLTESALVGAAGVLRAVDLAGSGDADVIWRYWSDLFSLGEPEERDHRQTWGLLQEAHARATATLLAWYLHVAVDERTPREVASRALRAVQKRIDLVRDARQLVYRIGAMTAEEDQGVSGNLWHSWTREEIPERQAVFIESLPTGLHRLLIFWTLIHGPREYAAVPEWPRTIQEDEVSRLTQELLAQMEMAGIAVVVTSEMVVNQFRAMRRNADQSYAAWLDRQPLDDERIERFRLALKDAWAKSRNLPSILEAAGTQVTHFASPKFRQIQINMFRAIFVADTDMVGEDWLGKDLGRQLALLEARAAFVHWRDRAQHVPANWTIDILMRMVAETQPANEAPNGVLLLPYDWQVDEWARLNSGMLAGFNIQIATSSGVPEDEALLVVGGEEVWQIGRDDDVDFELERVRLETDADQAQVLMTLKYSPPVASGTSRCWLIPTQQLIGVGLL